jgi:hypothetical protein
VYISTDSSSVAVVDSCYDRLKEDVLVFRKKGSVVLLDFTARVGRSVDLDGVIGVWEGYRNASGNTLVSILNEVELVACIGRKLVTVPEWTRVGILPSF